MSEPAALEWSADNCTIGRALDVIGDRWSLLVLREVFQGIRRFDQLTVRTAIPRQMLTDRLDQLVADGLLRREPYQEPGQRRRHEYRLTDKGLDLYPVLLALQTGATPTWPIPRARRSSSCTATAGSRSTWCCAAGPATTSRTTARSRAASARARGVVRRRRRGSSPADGRQGRGEKPPNSPEGVTLPVFRFPHKRPLPGVGGPRGPSEGGFPRRRQQCRGKEARPRPGPTPRETGARAGESERGEGLPGHPLVRRGVGET